MGLCALKSILLIAVLLSIIFSFLPGTAYAQQVKNYKITLRSRSFTPQPGIKQLFRDSLTVQVTRGEKRHIYVQLNKHLTIEERAELEEQGVKLLSYIRSYTWYATMVDRRALNFAIPDSVSRTPILGTMRWVGEIQPEDRIEPDIIEDRLDKWIKTEDNRERYSIYFFKDVSMDNAREIITRLGGEIEGDEILTKGFFVILPPGIRDSLMNEDKVKFIDLTPPPDIPDNNGSRTWCNTDVVHAAGLTGNGIILGQWEAANGLPRNLHIDLTAGRCNWEDTDPAAAVHWHATHVCGTMLGTGAGNAARMGHAPGVGDVRCYTSGGATGEMAAAIGTHGIVAANNSWGKSVGWARSGGVWYFEPSTAAGDPIDAYAQTYFGDYRWSCPAFDQLVRDSGLVIVFSSGNDRDDPDDGSETNAEPGDLDQIAGAGLDSWDGYHTVRPYATTKNVITVGAVNDATGVMAAFSNWGPTDDGRIKPDIVAPGVNIWSCYSEDNDLDGTFDDYVGANGTSASAPAVTGIAALLIQSYREDCLDEPNITETLYPSTIKAILCQTAQDMGDPGPDYQFGYGGVRADEARQLIVDRRFREGVIASMDDQDIYEFVVGAGDPEIRITMAWDDHEAGAGNPNPTIINDLDLVVEDPAGNYYTPWHLHITAHNQAVNPATHNSHAVASTDLIPEADRDRWNNVEQVLIDPALTGAPLVGGTWRVIVEPHALPEAPQRYSLAANYVLQGNVEIVQVLDRSGSMLSDAESGSPDRKIDILMDAANALVDLVESNEGHKMGLVKYRENVVPFSAAVDLSHEVTDPYKTTMHNMIDEIDDDVQGWHMTSIGDGLYEALTQFDTHGDIDNRQVIILMTDGKGNSTLGVDDLWTDPAWANSKAIIYTLGLGYDGGICSDTLAWLADSTGGDFRQTTDPLEFMKFFIEALASAVAWGPATDPVSELSPEDQDSFPVIVTDYDKSITFTAYWSNINNAIDLLIFKPNGDTISTSSSGVRYAEGDRYILYQIQRTESNWVGEWFMNVRSKSRQTVRYSTTSLVESSLKLETGFDKLHNLTGDRIRIWARLTASPTLPLPPPKPKIIAYCDKPLEGVGNVLHAFNYGPAKLQPTDSLADYDPITHKLDILRQQTGEEILPRGAGELVLYDDGAHDDGAAGDGLYANSFTDTKIQGSYTFRFVASDIPSGSGLKTTREWTKSFYNQVNIDPKYSDINITLLAKTADGMRYSVKIVPKDQFGNFLGPGHPVVVRVSHPGAQRQIQLNDNIDGTYTKEIFITQSEADADAILEIDIDGKRFTTAKLEPKLRKFSLSIHGGIAVPIDNFADDFEQGFNVLVDLDYHFTQQLSFVGFFGYNDFKSKTAGIDDNYWMNVSANLKYREQLRPQLYFYFNGGPGYYIPETGDSRFGLNLGAGFNYDYTNTINFELGADYHTIFDEGIQFVHSHAGLIFRF